jgi:hypothetical protein
MRGLVDDDTAEQSERKRTAAGRVLALLGAFSRGGGSLTLSEIARHADLSLTTAHRLAKEVLDQVPGSRVGVDDGPASA